jgi:pyridoxal phosphate enzyme (YggS family)
MSEVDVEGIAARLRAVRAQIAEAARRAGRAPEEVRLLAVSKTKPPEAIRAAYAAGQREFGENYVQELAHKAEALRDLDGIVWHFIGRLQRNKARDVARLGAIVEVVDREELARELDRRALAEGRRLDVMIEVHVGGEASKGGAEPEDVPALAALVRASAGLRLVGLMTIPPPVDHAEQARPSFAALRALRDRCGGPAALPHLSMGMSSDYEVAIAEGATIVRVGTAIFGAREAHAAPGPAGPS